MLGPWFSWTGSDFCLIFLTSLPGDAIEVIYWLLGARLFFYELTLSMRYRKGLELVPVPLPPVDEMLVILWLDKLWTVLVSSTPAVRFAVYS